jgi:PAS domain S-box-containing protein
VDGASSAGMLGDERFRALIEHGADAICLFDARGIIVYANPATERIFGHPAASLVGVDGWQLIHPDDHQAAGSVLGRMMERPGERIEFPRYRLRHGDGSWRWVETNATNLLHVPTVAALMANYRDVTDRVQLEDQLLQAQKMEAIGLLAGGVAHDFNNLLTVILGFSDHAAHALVADHPAARDLAYVKQAAQSAAELTQKLLTFARRQIRRSEIFDLGASLRHFIGLLARIVGEDVTVTTDVPNEPLLVEGDQAQIEQVLLNLCTNARQAMPKGGQLRLSARRIPGAALGDAARCVLEVFDNGTGMTKEVRQRVFEPFFTSRPGGTGLGMSVVFGVVQDHRGSIDIESAPGRGTRVRIELPLREGGLRPLPPESTPVTGGSETVLLAEDEPLVRALMADALGRYGYTVLLANDGEEAVEVFLRQRDQIALVVLDAIMPKLGGRQAFERMRELEPDLRAVFISGYAPEAPGIAELMATGRVALLRKPFLAAELGTQIRAVLDQR